MDEIINEYKEWIQRNGVIKSYEAYSRRLEELRNGFFGNTGSLTGNAKTAFDDDNIKDIIKENDFKKDIFDINEVEETIDLLKNINEIFFDLENIPEIFTEYDKQTNNQPRAAFRKYIKFLEATQNQNAHENLNQNPTEDIPRSNPSNKIYFGAPGTGKSHKVQQITQIHKEEGRVKRITFHPEFDYASFVGGYKPTMNGDNIRYEFVPQAFTKIYVDSWNDLNNDYYLVIEEINRGNCAEIFGDIFQLLDRTNDFETTPSKELGEYLESQFDDNEYINSNNLRLPPNLNILATMNTSDQSLFPMDSAFKRRWDWEYIPINYSRNEIENPSAAFKVKLSDKKSFKWIEFIEKINEKISGNDNLGMDKCLGNYFIKPDEDENTISMKSFINKVIFYLWNDVFKDEMEDESIFKDKITYEKFFPIKPDGSEHVRKIIKEILDVHTIENTTPEV